MKGDYLSSAIWEAYAFADVFTLGYASKAKITAELADASVKLGKSFLQGGKTFAQYKAARGGTETLGFIPSFNKAWQLVDQRISTEFAHIFITQRMQRAYNLPNWMVNNRLNVWKLNTIQHSLIDSYRFNFLRYGFKSDVGWFGRYNWFTRSF